MIWVNVAAIVLSPLIAVLVSVFLQHRREQRNQKLWIFNTLVSTRHQPIVDENVRALNMIDVAYHDEAKVRTLWREYYAMLSNQGLNNQVGWQQRQTKNLEMITEMAKAVGYGNAISYLDVDRVYYPVGLGEASETTHQIGVELLRVLKASGGVQFVGLPASAPEHGGPNDAG